MKLKRKIDCFLCWLLREKGKGHERCERKESKP